MRPLVRLERRGKEWAVIMRSGRVEFADTCYAKAVGVFEYLESRRKSQEHDAVGDRTHAPTPAAGA